MYSKLIYILLFLCVLQGARAQQSQPAAPALFLIAEHDRAGYINELGEKVVDTRYYNGMDYSEGLMAVRENGLYGYIDRTGRYTIAPEFELAYPFYNGLAVVYRADHFFYIDTTGREAFPVHYATLGWFFNNRANIRTYGGHEGIINRQGKLVIDTIYRQIGSFSCGVAVVNKTSTEKQVQVGVIDTTGRIIVPFGIYTAINTFNDGYAVVTIRDKQNKEANKTGAIDHTGKLLFARPDKNNCYIQGRAFSNGLAKMNLYKYWIPEKKGVYSTSEKDYEGYINLRNEVVLNDTTVRTVGEFSDGRAFIEKGDSGYCLIDTAMHRVGTGCYKRISGEGFVGGYAIVNTDSGWGIIDTNARWVVPPSFDNIDETGIRDGYFFYGKDTTDGNRLYGIATINGTILFPAVLEDFDRSGFVNGLLKGMVNGRFCYINQQGKMVWQNQDTAVLTLSRLNTDYMLRAAYLAYSTPEKEGEEERGGGWYISHNVPRPAEHLSFAAQALSLAIDVEKTDTFAGRFIAHPLYVANMTADTVYFNAEDSKLYMKLQAREANGEWKYIEYMPGSWCGNSYHVISLEPAHYWSFVIPELEGIIPVQLRVELKYKDKTDPKKEKLVYSNVIEGHINPAQWWHKQSYQPNGIMDPYND